MKYFRVLLTILAAFGPFMAYVCRLNLSLIIEEMVVKAPGDEGAHNTATNNQHDQRPLAPLAQQVSQEHAELARRLPSIFSEEQSLAELSSGASWLRARNLKSERKKSRLRANATQWGHPASLPAGATAQLLSISIDVNPNAQKARDGSDPAAGTTPGPQATNASSSVPSAGQADRQRATTEGPDELRVEPVPAPSAQLLPWSKDNRNDLLGAFFLGYVIFQVPAGRAAELLGPKLLFLVLGLGTGLTSLVFPFACRWSEGIWLAYAVRFVMGASQAGLFPAVYVLLCNWLPKSERSSWLAVPSAMGRIGTIAMNFAVPAIMARATWEWVFYLSGLLTLAWALVFLALGSDGPASSYWLSRQELVYIETRMEGAPFGAGQQDVVALETPAPKSSRLGTSRFSLDSELGANAGAEQVVKRPSIDWLKMLRSRALLILTLVMFTSEWSNMLLLVKLPGFLGPALRMDLDEVGLWSSALVAIYCVQYPLAGVLAARLEAADLDLFDSLRVRKLFELAAHIMQAAACLAIALFNNKAVVLTSLVVMMLGRSTVGGGQCLMPPELSKDYPGTVMAVANSMANLAGVVGPMVVTLLVDEPTEYDSWRNLWLLSAGIFTLGGALFCLLADNRPQNYCKKPKLEASKSTSRAQLVLPPYVPPPQMSGAGDSEPASGESKARARQRAQQQQQQQQERQQAEEPEIVRMDAFARVSSEPKETR